MASSTFKITRDKSGSVQVKHETVSLNDLHAFLQEGLTASKSILEDSELRLGMLSWNGQQAIPPTAVLRTTVVACLDILDLPQTAWTVRDTPEFDHGHIKENVVSPSDHLDGHYYYISSGMSAIAWKHHYRTSTTIGLAWDLREGTDLEYIMEGLRRLSDLLSHPLLPGVLMHQAMISSTEFLLDINAFKINQAQQQTGFHAYTNVAPILDVNTQDLANLSTKITGIGTDLAAHDLFLRGLHEYAQLLLRENKNFTSSQTMIRNLEVKAMEISIENEMERWVRKTNALLRQTESWERKASLVVAGLFNLITQRDANISIGIARDSRMVAEDSKRDSTSMKAIAAVTMCFLPGTFVASLFSMPMFQWDVHTGNIVDHRFWIYWAITIPLTILVLAIWYLWSYIGNKPIAKLKAP